MNREPVIEVLAGRQSDRLSEVNAGMESRLRLLVQIVPQRTDGELLLWAEGLKSQIIFDRTSSILTLK